MRHSCFTMFKSRSATPKGSAGSLCLAVSCIIFTALGLQPSSALANGTTVYKSVDGQGRVTYSDQPPAADALVEVLTIESSPSAPSPLDVERIEAMRQATDRMAADRREREESRARVREVTQSRQAQNLSYESEDYWQYSGNYYPVHRPHHPMRPGYRPPGVRPPGLRPPQLKPRPGPLPAVNDYPASLVRRHYTGGARRVFYND